MSAPANDVLSLFLPPVGAWFRQALGTPTPAQEQGWPAIATGQHTLILAPTGSGKTLAAFLACLDQLWRQTIQPWGVQVLYVSPLKALNNDIHRNLQVPLAGVAATAERLGTPLPELKVAVRTGDTPTRERQQLARKPPHVLITTPESLNLILTSQARASLRSVRWCIVDEIHALCPNKRGVFLSLLLERLEELTPQSFLRIGLSATQRPLEEVARYLGGSAIAHRPSAVGQSQPADSRAVTIIDAGLRKQLDLQVLTPVEQFGPLPERTIWPSIYRLLLDQIRQHRSTIIFGNNRRTVERVTTQLNELAAGEAGSPPEPAEPFADLAEVSPHFSQSELATLPSPLEGDAPVVIARAHHGSVSLEVRQQIEEALKEGRLPAVVATASLELGIDMGAVDLVCQVESPGSVARGLQRVGRAGHLVGQQSKGRLIAKTLPDLLEQAVLAREMSAGRVEVMQVPTNCLDVLAQQIVAMVAVDTWKAPDLYALVRRTYPYRDLAPEVFESVLEMMSGRYPSEAFRDLRPRVSWDRVHNQLHALPGSQQLALLNGGTIPDTGQFAAYIEGREVRIGELDEEFVYERRIGDTFVLGTTAWRIEDIGDDRIQVSRVVGVPAIMPFWRGEKVSRSRDLGLAMGAFLRELLSRLRLNSIEDWLQNECHLTPVAARNLLEYIRRQLEQAGCVPTDRTLLIEGFRDQLGDWHVAVLSPFGSRFNLALRLAVEGCFRQRYGYHPQCLHSDDGLLFRMADMDEPPLDLLDGLAADQVEQLILDELDDSALFAIRFRQNAARALLMPRTRPDQRAPLWLQRLKGRSLLQMAKQFPSFPVVVETYRECLHDHLDLPRLQQWLRDTAAGAVKIVKRRAETPSPFAASLLFGFTAAFMYDYDRVESRDGSASQVDKQILDQMLKPGEHQHLLDPRAIHQVEHRLRGVGLPPRSADEMAELLRRLGDLSQAELDGAKAEFLAELAVQGRAKRITLPGVPSSERWILVEEAPLYDQAFDSSSASPSPPTPLPRVQERGEQQVAAASILRRFLQTHAMVGLDDILARYPFERRWAERQLEEWVQGGAAVAVLPAESASTQFAVPANLQQVQRTSLALHRQEILSCPPQQFAAFLLRWQYRHPATRRVGLEGLRAVVQRLEGLPLPAELWEQTVFPSRVAGYQGRWLDELIQGGEWLWTGRGAEERGAGAITFILREHLAEHPRPSVDGSFDAVTDAVYEHLRQHGASFLVDIAQPANQPPRLVRRALWQLLRRSLATNDRFDVIRRGEEADSPEPPTHGRRTTRRRVVTLRPEGRWSLIHWGTPEPESQAVHQARRLLERYGIVSRELALMEDSLISWRVLYEVLSRMEWAGEVRRGYFVEGLSGAQFALPEAAQQLAALSLPSRGDEPAVLLHSLDPANLHGPGAPFEGVASRRAGNWLVLRAGRPMLWIENHGRRLSSAPHVNHDDLAAAVACLCDLLRTGHGIQLHGKVIVDEWNGQPIGRSEGRELLEAAGFVRDYQAMTLYAGW